MKVNMLILVVLAFLIGDCKDPCPTIVHPQKWHLGKYEGEISTTKPVLQIGDTLLFTFSLDRHLIDLDSQDLDIDIGLRVYNKITTTANPGDTIEQGVFKIDSTIYYVFDQYFDVIVKKGTMTNPYDIYCQLIENRWEIEIQYVAKKADSFWAHVGIRDIYTSQLKDKSCMEGDSHAFGAELVLKPNDNNRIDYLFQGDKEQYPDYYGFIVE